MTLVKEIMTPNPDWVAPTTPVTEAAKIMSDRDIGVLPIGKDDKLVGMITDRDIVTRCVAHELDLADTQVGSVMSEKVLYCRDTDDIDFVALNLGEQRVHRLPVIDGDKRLVGMITTGDIAAHGSASSAGLALNGIAG